MTVPWCSHLANASEAAIDSVSLLFRRCADDWPCHAIVPWVFSAIDIASEGDGTVRHQLMSNSSLTTDDARVLT